MADELKVTQEEAVRFCEHALRNIEQVCLGKDDLEDIRASLEHFVKAQSQATIGELVIGLEQAAYNLETGDQLYKCPGLREAARQARTILSRHKGEGE